MLQNTLPARPRTPLVSEDIESFPDFPEFSFAHTPENVKRAVEKNGLRHVNSTTPSPSPGSGALKRKAASANLGVKHSQSSRRLPLSSAKPSAHYQQQFLAHPDFPLINDIHSFAWGLKPRLIPDDCQSDNIVNDAHITSSGSPRQRDKKSRSHDSERDALKALRKPLQNIDQNLANARFDPNIVRDRSFRVVRRLSNASTPSLSKFPPPPQQFAGTPPSSSQTKAEPTTPTTYHLRGVSFEILNPRQSLCVKQIDTPVGDHDEQRADYFTTPLQPDMPPNLASNTTEEPEAPEQSPSQDPFDSNGARATPPRSLFNDLPSAYNSIASKRGRMMNAAAEARRNMPLPPTPIPTAQAVSDHQFREGDPFSSDMLDNTAGSPPHKSVRKRLSDALRLRRREQEGWRRSQTVPAMPEAAQKPLRQSSMVSRSAASVFKAPWTFANTAAADPNQLATKGGATSRHYYDDSSIIDSTSGRQISDSAFPTIFSSQQQHSSRSTNGSHDQSTGDIIASYADSNFNDSQHSFGWPSPNRRKSMPLLAHGKVIPQEGTSSTIGMILDQYHRQDDTADAFYEHASSRARRRASMPSIVSSAEVIPARKLLGEGGSAAHNGVSTSPVNNKDIKTATARALHAPRGALPALPLPSDPGKPKLSQHLLPGSQASLDRSVTPTQDSYGDTRNLLMLSSTPIEHGRGAASSRHGHLPPDQMDALFPGASLQALPHRKSEVLSAQEQDSQRSSRSAENIIEEDIKYFSRLSGPSQVSRSIFLFEDKNGERVGTQRLSEFEFQFDRQNASPAPPPQAVSMKRASTVPVAAFAQNKVEPGSMRLTPGQRKVLDAPADYSASRSSHASESDDEDDDDHDWQTVSDSRRTLRSRSYLTEAESICDVSSYKSSTFKTARTRPADDQFQYSDRFTSPNHSQQPILLPSYGSRANSRLADRNDLAPPTPALYTTYTHPFPLSDSHASPFTSSPPQITGSHSDSPRSTIDSELDTASSKASHHPTQMYHNRNLSIILEQTEHNTTTAFKFDTPKLPNAIHSSSSSVVLSETGSSQQLGSEPGPSVSLAAEDGSPDGWMREKTRRTSDRLNSGADAGLLRKLREDDPRMASSPLNLSNSFAKLSHLGPKGNVTGTPEGTGMRATGSSVVGSSSPPELQSSPLTDDPESPQTPGTPQNIFQWATGHPLLVAFDPASPLANYDQQRYSSTQHVEPEQISKRHRRHGSHLTPPVQPRTKIPKRAVSTQRHLMQMKLMSRDELNDSQSHIDRISHETVTTKTGTRPLLPMGSPPNEPRLRSRYRSPSSHASELRNRKHKISWICFAICTMFPYLLILYGHSALDSIMTFMTRGQIQHFGQRQKKVARIVGWTTAAATVVALIVGFVVIRTVPNDFPR